MKKFLLISSLFIASIFFAPHASQAAVCNTVPSVYPGGLDTFHIGDCVPSASINNLESSVGTSTATSSVRAQIAAIAASSSFSGVTSFNGQTGTVLGYQYGSVPVFGSPIIATGTTPATIFGNASTSYILNFNTKIQFPSTSQLNSFGCAGNPTIMDPFSCLQYIYNQAPAAGLEIDVPVDSWTGNGSFVATTANKNILVQCVPGGGSVFNETATSGIAMLFGAGSGSHVGDGIIGCKVNGPNSGTGVGIAVSSTNSNAGEGFLIKDVYTTHFYRNWVTGSNVYLLNIDHSYSRFNATNNVGGGLLWIQNTNNTGETIGIGDGTLLSDGQPAANSVEFDTSGENNIELTAPCSIDDAQEYINMFGGQGNNVHDSCHHENPAEDTIPTYIPIVMNSGNPYLNTSLVLTNATFQQDAVTNVPACFISLYGQLTMQGVGFDGSAFSGGPVPNAVCLGSSQSTIYSSGSVFGGSDGTTGFPGATNLYNDPILGEIPITGGVQTYNVTSTFAGQTKFYTTPTDAGGAFFVTSTPNYYVDLGKANAPVLKSQCVGDSAGSVTHLTCTLTGVSTGDTIIVSASPTSTVTDTMGSSYASSTSRMWYANNVDGTTTFVVSSTFPSATFSFLSVLDYSGLATSSVLDFATSTTYSSLNKNTVFSSGTSTPSQAGDLIIGYQGCNDGAGVSNPVPPFSSLQTNPDGGCDIVSSYVSHNANPISAPFMTTSNWANGSNATVRMSAFKAAILPVAPTYNVSIGSSSTQPTTFSVSDINHNSSTLRIGGGTSRFSCIETNDSVNSSTLEYWYTISSVLVTTTTKPNFCE